MLQASKKTFKRGVRSLVWSGILAAASIGGWLVYVKTVNRPPEAIAVKIVTVKLDTIENTINESGTVQLGGQQTLQSPIEGAVDRVLVNLGDRVRFGQELITLRNPERQTLLTTQQLEIQKQELTLETNRQKVAEVAKKLKIFQQEFQELVLQRNLEQNSKNTTNKLEIRQQELTLARSHQKLKEAEEKLQAEKIKLQEVEALDRKGFIPRNELRDQQEKVLSTESNLRDAKLAVSTDTLKLQSLQIKTELSPPQIPEKVMTARDELRQAQLAVSTDIRQLEKLKLDLQKSQQQLQEFVVIAPISGKILNIMVRDGDGIDRRTNLLTLGDPAEELVQLQLSTLNAAQVKPGQLARISVIGPNPKVYNGRVESLDPLATSGGKDDESSSSSQSNKATVPATVKLDSPTRSLIPGSQVNVEIILQQKQNVVTLNTEAIQREGGKPFVWVKDPTGKAQKRSVTLGLEGLTTIEVTAGLKVGEKLVLPPSEEILEEGTPVKEIKDEEEKEE